jgi:phosphate-selective porin OprO/OprP
MKNHPKFRIVLAAAGLLSLALPSLADDAVVIEQLRQQIQALDQKVRILERKQELDVEARAERAKTIPTVSVGASGLSIQSTDSNFVAQIHGLLQVDNRTFFHDKHITGNDSIVLRRVRPIFSGTLFKDIDYQIVPEFGGSSPSIVDAYLNYRFRPELQLRAGRFKVPVGLEYLQSDTVTAFAERSLVTDLVPGRDLGFQLGGDIAGGVASYAVGVFNGVGDARNSSNSDFEDHREVAGRLFFQPFKNNPKLAAFQGLGLGVGASFGNTSSNATGLPNNSGFATDGQQTFFAYTNGVVANGDHFRISPQASYYYGPFSLLGEYALSEQRVSRSTAPRTSATLRNTGWGITAGWVLTGESAAFNGVTPRKPFSIADGGWGAFQLVGRYAALDIDDKTFPLYADPLASATEARAWGVGLNWYLNKNFKLATSYHHTDFSGGGRSTLLTSPAVVTRQAEDLWLTRVQLSF